MEKLDIIFSETNTHITNSYKVKNTRAIIRRVLSARREASPDMAVNKRSVKSQVIEWRAHNLSYYLHLFRKRTVDIDLEYPQKPMQRACYAIASLFYLW